MIRLLTFLMLLMAYTLSVSAVIPVRSVNQNPSSPQYYDNTGNNKLLTPEVKTYLESRGAMVGGNIDTVKLGEIQRELGLVGADGTPDMMLGRETIEKLSTLRTLGSGPAPIAPGDTASLSSTDTVATPSTISTKGPTTVYTTERIPGAKCKCDVEGDPNRGVEDKDCSPSTGVDKRKYICTVGTGLAGFQDLFREILRWVVYISLLLGVLALVGLGVMWALLGSTDEGNAKLAKKWAVNIIIGFILLLSFRYILGFLAPWIYG